MIKKLSIPTVTMCLVLLLSMLSFMAACEESGPPTEVIELKYASPWASSSPLSLADLDWIAKVEKETNSRVKITPYWEGTLISPVEGYDQLQAGVFDIGYVMGVYGLAGFDIERSSEAFYYPAAGDITESAELKVRVYKELAKEFPEVPAQYAGAKCLGMDAASSFGLAVSKPINSIEDLKGLTIRGVSGWPRVFQQLGAEGVSIPMGEVYTSLQKNIIDGAFVPPETLQTFNFAEVVTHYYEMNIPKAPGWTRLMSWDSYNKLPEDIQKVFDNNIDYLTEQHTKYVAKQSKDAIEFAKESGVNVMQLPPEAFSKFLEACDVVAHEDALALDDAGYRGTEILQETLNLIDKYK